MFQMIGFGAVSTLTIFHRNMANIVRSHTTEKATKFGLLMDNRGESYRTTLEIMDNSLGRGTVFIFFKFILQHRVWQDLQQCARSCGPLWLLLHAMHERQLLPRHRPTERLGYFGSSSSLVPQTGTKIFLRRG